MEKRRRRRRRRARRGGKNGEKRQEKSLKCRLGTGRMEGCHVATEHHRPQKLQERVIKKIYIFILFFI